MAAVACETDRRGCLSLLRLVLIVSAGMLQQAAQGQTGIITTIAGVTPVGGPPVRGYSGDGGPAANAMLSLANRRTTCNQKLTDAPNGLYEFDEIVHLSVDRSGNVYFADSNNQRIRRITPSGIISTVVGSGELPPVNGLCEAVGGGAAIGDGGPATSAKLYYPADAIVHPNGNLIIADQQNNRIRQVTPDGVMATVAGNGLHTFYSPGIPATSSPMDWPSAVALDSNGVLYFAEMHSNRVGKIGADGRIATVAGTGFPGFNGDNRAATTAQLFAPAGIAFDGEGNLYIADQSNHRIRKVAPDGRILPVAGTGSPGFSGDGGPAERAQLLFPNDVAVDTNGNLYIADMGNNRIRRVDRSGVIRTVAGDGALGRGPDGVPGTSSSLSLPAGVAVDSLGDLYIVDWQNYLIRKLSFNPGPVIRPSGIVNGASFAPAPAPVAPGSIISIFGVNLAASTAQASEAPLPSQLAGATVKVNEAAIPLFFVSPGQINAQLPFEVAPGTATAVVNTASGESRGETFNVASSAAGIFQFADSNRAIALNQDGSLNGPDNPEKRGNVIVVFLTGQGPVNPPVPTGQAAVFDRLSRAALAMAANIDGTSAPVQFLGLTPGFVGLAQANVQIPAAVTPGNNVMMFISVNGQQSNTVTISVR